LLTLPWTASSEEIRTASPEEIEVIEKNMDQMKFILDPSTVKVKSMALTDQTYCGRIDATRKNGTKMTDFTVYGTWFWGEAVAPIATGVAARRMCDKDKFPPK
jgi:hypothetical protein